MGVLEKGWKKNLTVPNIISLVRILLIIPLIYYLLEENYLAAVIILVISGLSDMLDGLIARKFNQVTELGKLLDPVADKLTLVAIVVCIGLLIPQSIPLLTVLIIKDMLMLAGGFFLLKKGITPPAAKWYGKVATTIFYISMVVIVLGKAVFNYENEILTVSLLTITTASMLFALVKYFKIFLEMLRENDLKKVDKEDSEKILTDEKG